ncbi:hypothetical protein ACFVH6_25665 [Spirillospora sp. NPDC127200]
MRHWFGQSPADWTVELAGDRSLLATGGVALTFWSAPVGGFRYTDLLQDGKSVSTIYSGNGTTAPLGTIARFQGPDGIALLYADAGAGTRWAMPAVDLGAALSNHTASLDPHGDRAAATAYTDQAVSQLAAQYGAVPMDSFDGSTDDAKFQAALAYAAAQTYSPTVVLPNRQINLTTTYTFFDGLKLSGPIASREREFRTTGPQCIVSHTKPLFAMPTTHVRNVTVRGIQFRAAGSGIDWMVRSTDFVGGPIMQDADFRDLAWDGYSSIMHARHLRCSIERMYANNGSDVQFKLAGSDNAYWTEGYSYLSGSLPATSYYLYFTHMSRSRVGALYVTPQKATALRIDGSYGGLSFDGTLFDSTGRDATMACQGSAVFLNAGEGYVFRNCWFFNNAVAPATTGRSDKGQVYVKTGVKETLFDGCQFSGGSKQTVVTPAGTPAIYAQAGTSIRVSNPLAPNGGEKKLQQAAAGCITCDDPNWTITTAA